MPFEEDERDPSIWFLDHSYLENMFRMFKKVNGERRPKAWLRRERCAMLPLPWLLRRMLCAIDGCRQAVGRSAVGSACPVRS